MKTLRSVSKLGLGALSATGLLALAGCGASNSGTPGSSAVSHPPVQGTVFTIVFENHDENGIIGSGSDTPYFNQLAQQYASSAATVEGVHPSLPNYIKLTSGQTYGIADDNPPASHPLDGHDNLPDQLDAAGVPWRAYMESMGSPCGMDAVGDYAPKHDPFVYYTSVSGDRARCESHVVDLDQNLATDLAANTYRYMWITPNMCDDMHNCSPATADAWLARIVPQIMASPGYQHDGVIFITFDEGGLVSTITNTSVNIPMIVVSPHLVRPGYRSQVAYDHRSYLATVEDIFGMPRLATTQDATPMSDFFTSSN